MKPEWLREAEAVDDRLRAEREYEELVAHHRDDESIVRKSAAHDDVVYKTTTRSEPAPPFSDAQLDVLAEVVAKLQDEIENLRKTVRANDVAALNGKVDALLALLSSPARTHDPKKGEVIDLLPNWRRRDAS